MPLNPKPEPIPVQKALPNPGVWVTVITPGYRCLGYLRDGVWRDVVRDRPIDDVVAWVAQDEPSKPPRTS